MEVKQLEPRKRYPCLAFAVLLFVLGAVNASAHDIPNDVTLHIFLKPDGQRVQLLVRAPLAAMQDVQYTKLPNGYVDLSQIDFPLRNAAKLWISNNFELYEGETLLAEPTIVSVRPAILSDRSIASYEDFMAHLHGPPLREDTTFDWNQGFLDVHFEYTIQSDRSNFSIQSQFARLGLRTLTVLRFMPPDNPVRAFEFRDDPGLVRLDPRWHQAALQFVRLGFLHILDGIDHLLFLFCLVIPFRRIRQLVLIVTSFTVAHSITLIASAYNIAPDALWFPPLVETLIAMSILYMALENIVGSKMQLRWIITFGFGLIHGFGFSFALRETLQFAGSHMLTSLLAFNIGVELGQLLVLILLIPALDLLFRRVVQERIGTIVLSAIVAHTAWHWMVDRANALRQFQFEWPALTIASALIAVRLSIVIVVAAGVMWVISVVVRGKSRSYEL
jgi:hypothetical protein